MSTSIHQGQMLSSNITGIFGVVVLGTSIKFLMGLTECFSIPCHTKARFNRLLRQALVVTCKRIFHNPYNPLVNHYCSLKCKEEQVHGKPAWLQPFLLKEFFNNCSAHNLSNNETNMYCIDCDLPICKHCFSPSGSCGGHRTLRIYKHVKQDAVVGKDLKELIDCSKIQLYKCNKNRVVVVHPLDNNKVKDQEVAGSCDICKRILHNPAAYRYCSLECKVKAFLRKEKATDPPFLKLGAAAAAAAADGDAAEAAGIRETAAADIVETTAERKKKRKGVPHRAI